MTRIVLPLALLALAACSPDPVTYTISATNMAPTLQPGDRVECSKDLPDPLPRGAVVAFDQKAFLPESRRDGTLIFRVVGLPGEAVHARGDGSVTVGGRVLEEPYRGTADTLDSDPVTVPERAYYVLGDNRAGSSDSRFHGTVPHDAVVATCTRIVAPGAREGRIPGT